LQRTGLSQALQQISGVPVTAYQADGEIDFAQSGKIARRIGEAGVRNVIAVGNTGEFFSLTLDEVRRLTAHVIETVADAAHVTASAGRSLKEAIALGRAAAADGASAVMAHFPADPFAGPAEQIAYFLRLADAVPVPVVAYLRSDKSAPGDLVSLAEHDNVIAIKYAAPNPLKLGEAISATRHCDTRWVCGLAESWVPSFYAQGARGFTSGLVNVFPQISLAVHAAAEAGDFAAARDLIERIAPFERMRTMHENGCNVTVVKEALGMTGWHVGPVRLPGVQELAPGDRDELAALVKSLSEGGAK